MHWFGPWRLRQYELAQGVDASLVRDNQRRHKVALGLLVFALMLFIPASKVHLSDSLRWIVGVTISGSVLAAFVLHEWARQEAAFMGKRDSEKPPK